MTRATATLLSEAEFMVKAFSHQYARRFPGVRKEDLAQEGRRVVLELAQRYDPDRGSAFATYCYHRLLGALLDYAKKETQSALAVFVTGAAQRDEGPDPSGSLSLDPDPPEQVLHDTLQGRIAAFVAAQELGGAAPSVEEVHRNASRSERVRAAVASLPEDESTFVRLFYEDELTLDEVASAMGISKRSVGRTHQRVKKKLTSRLFEAVE